MKEIWIQNITIYLQKNQKKIISISDFKKLLLSSFPPPLNEGRIYKLTHQLKNRGYLVSIKKDIFLITSPEKIPSEEEMEELFYRKLLKKHCQQYCKTNRYIGGLTALELHLHGTSATLPDEVIIYNSTKQAIETVLLKKKVNFKTYEAKTKNLYPLFAKQTSTIRLKGWLMKHANLELATLECLYNLHPSNAGYIEGLIIKTFKKYQKTINLSNFQYILKQGKHNTSANRLQKLIKPSQPQLAEEIKKLIKRHGHIL